MILLCQFSGMRPLHIEDPVADTTVEFTEEGKVFYNRIVICKEFMREEEFMKVPTACLVNA